MSTPDRVAVFNVDSSNFKSPSRDRRPTVERERGRDAARKVIQLKCRTKNFQILDERLVQDLNYYARFKCG
jgi:hypothetical protein